MSYISPIELIDDITEKINLDIEHYIYNTVVTAGIDIDIDELIKALKYDREQYQKGYQDGYSDWCATKVKPLRLWFKNENDKTPVTVVDIGGTRVLSLDVNEDWNIVFAAFDDCTRAEDIQEIKLLLRKRDKSKDLVYNNDL